jgi:hypothetical protein
MSLRKAFNSDPVNFVAFVTLCTATVGSIVYFREDLFAPTEHRRRRFEQGEAQVECHLLLCN